MAQEDQKAVSKWSEELLGAFTAISTKTEAGLQVVKDIAEFYRARAKIEDQYAKAMAALYKSPPGAGFFTKEPAITKEHRTLKEAILGVLERGLKSSEAHQDFANKINNEICKNLDGWVRAKTNDRLKAIGEGQKHVKTVSDAKAAVNRNRAEYERLMKEMDVAREQLLKAEKDEQTAPDNKRLPPITKKATEKWLQLKIKAKAAEISYQEAVKKANEEVESHNGEKMPIVFENLQTWEEDRWNVLLNSVKSYKVAQEAVPVVIDAQAKELVSNYEAADIEADFREFINSNKKEDIPLDDGLEFIAYKSKFADEEEKKEEPVIVEKKEEPKKVEEQPKKKEEPKKVEEQPKKKEEPAVVEKKEEPLKPEDAAKKEAEKKKNDELKANLFGDSSDIFQ